MSSVKSMLSEGNVKLTFETALKKCLKQFNGKEDCCILMYFDDIDKRKFIMNTLTKSLLCKHLFAVLTTRKKDYDNDNKCVFRLNRNYVSQENLYILTFVKKYNDNEVSSINFVCQSKTICCVIDYLLSYGYNKDKLNGLLEGIQSEDDVEEILDHICQEQENKQEIPREEIPREKTLSKKEKEKLKKEKAKEANKLREQEKKDKAKLAEKQAKQFEKQQKERNKKRIETERKKKLALLKK
jgi:hypothetical protein